MGKKTALLFFSLLFAVQGYLLTWGWATLEVSTKSKFLCSLILLLSWVVKRTTENLTSKWDSTKYMYGGPSGSCCYFHFLKSRAIKL